MSVFGRKGGAGVSVLVVKSVHALQSEYSRQERSFIQVAVLNFLCENMWCEDFLVVFCLLFLTVERLKECQDFWYGVVGPLLMDLAEERGVKTYASRTLLGGHRFFMCEGRPVPMRNERFAWDFDSTRGFPGEDIYVLFC